jgi:hypothetical protein
MYGSDSTTADLENEQRFENSWNVAETAILVLLGFMIVGGLLGAFGGGVLSRAEQRTADNRADIRYERILRKSASSAMRIDATTPDRTLVLELDQGFAAEVSSTVPRAAEVAARPDGIAYTFAVDPGQPVEITINTKPQKAGWFQRQINLLGSTVMLPQIVLP